MALDGIVMANLAAEMKNRLGGGKIAKIAQPEKDELLFTIKNQKKHLEALNFGQRQPPPDLFYRSKQTKSHDCSEFLYALKKAHWKRTHYSREPARPGADPVHGSRTLR